VLEQASRESTSIRRRLARADGIDIFAGSKSDIDITANTYSPLGNAVSSAFFVDYLRRRGKLCYNWERYHETV
jgi:hypothetical protein